MIRSAEINALETSVVSLFTGAADPDFPLPRIYDRNPGKLFKGATASTLGVKVDQGSAPLEVDRLLIPRGHNLFELSGIHYFPSSIVTNEGVYVSGDEASLLVVDGNYYDTREVSGSPCLEVEAQWTGLPQQISDFHFVGRYDGNPAHINYAEVYNENTLVWDRFTALANDLPSGSVDYNRDWTLPGTVSDYYAGSAGNWSIRIRFRHVSNGVPTHHLFIDFLSAGDNFELILEFSDDDITYSPAAVCTPMTSEAIDCPFLAGTHQYWKITFNTPDEPPALGELFLTSTYEWLKDADNPDGPREDITNSIKDITASGSQRGVILGPNRRQKVYNMRIKQADYLALLDLFNTVGLAVPFWIDDAGTWIFVSFRSTPNFIQEVYQIYTATIDVLEVIDG